MDRPLTTRVFSHRPQKLGVGHARELGALIDLVGHDPGPDGGGQVDDALHDLRVEDGAGRVVGVGQDDELRLRRDQPAHLVEVGLPAQALPKGKGLDLGAEGPHEPAHLHIVRELEQDLVAGLEQAPHEQEVRLGGAGRGQDLLQADPRIEAGDPLAEADVPFVWV